MERVRRYWCYFPNTRNQSACPEAPEEEAMFRLIIFTLIGLFALLVLRDTPEMARLHSRIAQPRQPTPQDLAAIPVHDAVQQAVTHEGIRNQTIPQQASLRKNASREGIIPPGRHTRHAAAYKSGPEHAGQNKQASHKTAGQRDRILATPALLNMPQQ